MATRGVRRHALLLRSAVRQQQPRLLHSARALLSTADAVSMSSPAPVLNAAARELPLFVSNADTMIDDFHSTTALQSALDSPMTSYKDALYAYKTLRHRGVKLKEQQYLALVEKANLERRYEVIHDHFYDFDRDFAAKKVITPKKSSASWDWMTSEQLQLHRHVLWAMLKGGVPSTRFRKMEKFFHNHVRNKVNQLSVYESDSLNFLLRMECMFAFATHVPHNHDEWRGRVHVILHEMKMLKYRTNYSSSHALFHFLMHRPDLADGAAPLDEAQLEDELMILLATYKRPLKLDSKRISLAVSTAASVGRIALAISLLQRAEKYFISVDAASFAHAIQCATDLDQRLLIADMFVRAKTNGWVYNGDDNHSMKNYLLRYAIYDGNFTLIVELLQEMENCNRAASPSVATALFTSFASYRQDLLRRQPSDTQKKDKRRLFQAVTSDNCPTVRHLLDTYPSVLPRTTHVISHAVLQGLRAGDIDDAVHVLRTSPRSAPLRAEIFAQVVYALLVRGHDVVAVREVEQLFDLHHRDRDVLYAQLLHLCKAAGDVVTMLGVLHEWQAQLPRPLSHRAVQRVFDTVGKERTSGSDDSSDLILTFRMLLEKYPRLLPPDAWTVSQAVMRSATAGLTHDVAALLKLAQNKRLTLEPAAYRVALDKLHALKATDPLMSHALDECVAEMTRNGAWAMLVERDAAFARVVSE